MKKEYNIEKKKKEIKGFAHEFRQFISRGNVIDLAVGVVIGTAFSNIVNSLVNDIIMPIIGVIIGGKSFENLSFTIGDSIIKYGVFIQNIVNFIIIAFCIFVCIKTINKIKTFNKKEEVKEEPKPVPIDQNIQLLSEIRDLLKKEKSK